MKASGYPSSPRIAVAGVIHETNTYAADAAGTTPLSAFEQYRGDEIGRAFCGANHQVGGFIEGAQKPVMSLLHTFLGQATPSGTIDGDAYAAMKAEIVEGVRNAMPL